MAVEKGTNTATTTAVARNYASVALERGNYSAYLPFGYDTGYRGPSYDPAWKPTADTVTPPATMVGIYTLLQQEGVIPPYNKPFRFISYGSNIPTLERFLVDYDSQFREGATTATAVDILYLPPHMSLDVTDGQGQAVFRFVHASDQEFKPTQPVDMIWCFRASLYYYLRWGRALNPDLITLAGDVLAKYHAELKAGGAVVVDAREHLGSDPKTSMATSTAGLIEEMREELGVDRLFDITYVGQDFERVMILRKK